MTGGCPRQCQVTEGGPRILIFSLFRLQSYRFYQSYDHIENHIYKDNERFVSSS